MKLEMQVRQRYATRDDDWYGAEWDRQKRANRSYLMSLWPVACGRGRAAVDHQPRDPPSELLGGRRSQPFWEGGVSMRHGRVWLMRR